MKRKKIILFIIIITMLCFTGCSFSKERVKLLTEEDATNYAKEHFGEAKLKEIKSETNDEIVYTFIDEEYNFEYEITSYIYQFCLGGSCGDIYSEKTESNFVDKYYDFIISSSIDKVSNIENKYNVTIESNDGWRSIKVYYQDEDCATQAAFYSVYGEDENIKNNAANELAAYIKKVDNRKIFETCTIWIRDNVINSNGVYSRIDSISLK